MEEKKKLTDWAVSFGKRAKEKAATAASDAMDIASTAAAEAKEASATAMSWASEKVETAASTAKESAQQASNHVSLAVQDYEYKLLRPVFMEELLDQTYSFPKMICIVEPDKKHLESKICEGSVGYYSEARDLKVLNLYPSVIEQLPLTLQTGLDSSVFYIDPAIEYRYVDLNQYFSYYKRVRVHELEQVAFQLGAKYFSVKLKEKKKTFVTEKKKGTAVLKALPGNANATMQSEFTQGDFESIEIAAESSFTGSTSPVMPNLVYFKNEPDILSLIEMRMTQKNQLKRRSFSWEYSNSSGIKESQAAKIDAILKQMKISGDFSISGEAKKESNIILEYTVEF